MPDLRPDVPTVDLMPGSILAAARGCICPADQPTPDESLDIDCPIHGLLGTDGPRLPETA